MKFFAAFIITLTLLSSCSWFSNAEDIDIRNPKPGTEIDIKSTKAIA